jgi:hypothetical protein
MKTIARCSLHLGTRKRPKELECLLTGNPSRKYDGRYDGMAESMMGDLTT